MLNIHENLIDTLNEAEIYLLMHITRYMGQHGFAFPSNETLCTRTRWHLNTLKKHKRSLTEKGLIRVEARFKDQGGQTSNAYFVETDEIGIYLGARAGQKLAGAQNLYRGEEQKIAHPVGQNLDRGEVQDLAPEVLSTLSIKNLSIKRGEDAPAHFADAVKVSKGQPVIDFVPESLIEVEITGPDAPKSRKAKTGNEPGLSRHRYLTPAERWPAENMGLDGGWEAKKPAQVFADWFEATHRTKFPTITRPGMELLFGKLQEYAINGGNARIKKAGGYVWEDAVTNTWLDTPEKVRQYSIPGTGIPNVTQQAKMAREAGHTVTLKEEWAAKYAEMKANEAAKKGGSKTWSS